MNPEEIDSPDYQEERLGRTITAHVDTHEDYGSAYDTVRVSVRGDDTEGDIELTRHDLRELNRAVGLEERRPPKRNVTGTIENHLEIMDFGDFLSVNTPTAEFRITHRDWRDHPKWAITEHDEGHSLEIDNARTRRASTIELLERLGVLWEAGETSDDEAGEQS